MGIIDAGKIRNVVYFELSWFILSRVLIGFKMLLIFNIYFGLNHEEFKT